jgi:hypothetical protein
VTTFDRPEAVLPGLPLGRSKVGGQLSTALNVAWALSFAGLISLMGFLGFLSDFLEFYWVAG